MKSKMINIKDYDFQELLDPASNLGDVEFKIIDENSQELGTVRSHTFLLSLLSPVLKKMFLSREKGSIVVEITGPSFISFQTLIQFLYTGDESVITDTSSIDDLFDLYCLGDKYELRGSRNLIKEVVSSFKINQENWMHVLKGIKKYENTFLFEDLCNILQDNVQGFLKSRASTDPCFENIQESEDIEFYSWVKNRTQKWFNSQTEIQISENPNGQTCREPENDKSLSKIDKSKVETDQQEVEVYKNLITVNNSNLGKEELKDFKRQVSAEISRLGETVEKIEGQVSADKSKFGKKVEKVEELLSRGFADISKLDKRIEKVMMIKTNVGNNSISMKETKTSMYDRFPCFKNMNINYKDLANKVLTNKDLANKNLFCLDGHDVGDFPIDNAMVKARENIYNPYSFGRVEVPAGTAGFGYLAPDGKYMISWKNKGVRLFNKGDAVMYKCDGKH